MLTAQQIQAAALVAGGHLSLAKIAKRVGCGDRTLDEWKTLPDFQMEVGRVTADIRDRVIKRGIGNRDRRLRILNSLLRRSVGGIMERKKVLASSLEAQAVLLTAKAARRRAEAEAMEIPAGDKPKDVAARREALYWQREGIDAAEDLESKAASLRKAIPMVQSGVYRMELKSLHTGEKAYEVVPEFVYDHQAIAEMRAQMEQASIEVGDWKNKLEVTDATQTAFVARMAELLTPEELDIIETRMKSKTSSAAERPPAQ
jgi:hypothetical protein